MYVQIELRSGVSGTCIQKCQLYGKMHDEHDQNLSSVKSPPGLSVRASERALLVFALRFIELTLTPCMNPTAQPDQALFGELRPDQAPFGELSSKFWKASGIYIVHHTSESRNEPNTRFVIIM